MASKALHDSNLVIRRQLNAKTDKVRCLDGRSAACTKIPQAIPVIAPRDKMATVSCCRSGIVAGLEMKGIYFMMFILSLVKQWKRI